MVIVLVKTQRSVMDICDIIPSNASKLVGPVESEARPATLGHLLFAVGPAYSTTDNKAESQRSRTPPNQGRWEYGLEDVVLEVKAQSQVGTSG